jgi:hypothetical protein
LRSLGRSDDGGRIRLSLIGNRTEDGFLEVEEIMNLRLNADPPAV